MTKIKPFAPWIVASLGLVLLFSGNLLLKTKPNFNPQTTSSTPQPTVTIQPFNNIAMNETQLVLVTRVIDGDTIEIEDGTRVRLLGIDTPELGQCAGSQASSATSDLVLNKQVRLETDIQLKDKYGRTLAHVFVSGTHVNEELVKAGLATILTIPPNVKYIDKLLKAQQEAREAKLGIWGEELCPTPPAAATQTPGECTIKGNISSSGEKIYHIPSQRYYEKTKIEENKGERWFCTEDEAQTAGWRKSKI